MLSPLHSNQKIPLKNHVKFDSGLDKCQLQWDLELQTILVIHYAVFHDVVLCEMSIQRVSFKSRCIPSPNLGIKSAHIQPIPIRV